MPLGWGLAKATSSQTDIGTTEATFAVNQTSTGLPGVTASGITNDLTQDWPGTIVLLAVNGFAEYSDLTPDYTVVTTKWQADTGGGYSDVGRTAKTTIDDAGATSSTNSAICLHAAQGAAGDSYRVRVTASQASAADTVVHSTELRSGFFGFLAPPASTAFGGGTAEVIPGVASTWSDVDWSSDFVEQGYFDGGSYYFPAADDYLIIYTAQIEESGGGDSTAGGVRLWSGASSAKIPGTEVWAWCGHDGTGDASQVGGNSVMGSIIYTAVAGERLKLQYSTSSTNGSVTNRSVVIIRLPSDWEGFSGYDAGGTTMTTWTDAEMDTENNKSNYTHSTVTNPAEVTTPAESTNSLVLGSLSFNVGSAALGGRFVIDAAIQTTVETHVALSGGASRKSVPVAFMRNFASSAVLKLQGRTSGSTAETDSHLTILRVDHFVRRELEGYRFREDDGSESGASWLEDQDTDTSSALAQRLRILTDTTKDAPAEGATLQYRKVGDAESEWEDLS